MPLSTSGLRVCRRSSPCSGSALKRTWVSGSSSSALACVFAGVLLVGCAAEAGPPTNLPSSLQSTAVGPDDVFDVMVVGEKELSHEYQVHPDGTIDFEH